MKAGDVRLGKLRDKVTVERPLRSEDAATGELVNTWTTFATNLPAAIDASQTEREAGNKQTAVTRYSVTIRYIEALEGDTDARLVIDGRRCEITSSIDPDRRKRWLMITAIATE